ncbi:hypothetical protein [Paraconexibacter sp.]|uniref:hypothetical protein n=1 Tax=Paraconexibacter sp. TaxID=2949640 RepID=UPI003564D9B9
MGPESSLAERAVDHARTLLIEAGNPSWAALVQTPDGGFLTGPMVVARSDLALQQGGALAGVVPDGALLVVGCERAGRQLRFTVLDGDGRRVLRRDEIVEDAIGRPGSEIV